VTDGSTVLVGDAETVLVDDCEATEVNEGVTAAVPLAVFDKEIETDGVIELVTDDDKEGCTVLVEVWVGVGVLESDGAIVAVLVVDASLVLVLLGDAAIVAVLVVDGATVPVLEGSSHCLCWCSSWTCCLSIRL